ncbi:MAG: hypothetical protein JO097_19880 [Acidobacteriaceae bacterium]|nr:hypothetical protein [Acidobacteriaceae bacterium]MBV9296849.1 hypothetical protein [Acidobacteriaceae bacterium]
MEREIMSRGELKVRIDSEIKTLTGCPSCGISSIHILLMPDETGCNWSEGPMEHGDVPAEVCLEAFAAVVSEAKLRFNVDLHQPAKPSDDERVHQAAP